MNKLVASTGKSEDEVMAALRVTNYNEDMAADILKAHNIKFETLSTSGSSGPIAGDLDDESLFSTEASSAGADKAKNVHFAGTPAHLFVDEEEEERQAQLAAETQRHMDEARERRELEELERRAREGREAHKRAEREKRETEGRAKRDEQERQERSRFEQESARRQHDDEPSAAGRAAPAGRGRLFLDSTTGKQSAGYCITLFDRLHIIQNALLFRPSTASELAKGPNPNYVEGPQAANRRGPRAHVTQGGRRAKGPSGVARYVKRGGGWTA